MSHHYELIKNSNIFLIISRSDLETVFSPLKEFQTTDQTATLREVLRSTTIVLIQKWINRSIEISESFVKYCF